MRQGIILLVLLLVGLAPAPRPRPNRTQEDLEKWQGTWVAVALEYNRESMPRANEVRLVIQGNRLKAYQGQAGPYEYILRLDASRPPSKYELKNADPGSLTSGTRGIYRLEGNVLILCSNLPGENLPTAFEGPARGKNLGKYRRVR